MDVTALLVVSLITNANTSGSWANGDVEKSYIVTRTIECNHVCADNARIRFSLMEDYASYSVKYNAAGQVIEQTPFRLVNLPAPITPPLPPPRPVPRPGFVPMTPPPGVTSLMNLPVAPLPAAPSLIPPPPEIIPPLPARRAGP